MKKLYILALLGICSLVFTGCVEPINRYSWNYMEIHILNYTDKDVDITVAMKNGDPITKIVPPVEISMTRGNFKIDLDNTDVLTKQRYLNSFFITEYPFDRYNIGIEKAIQIGETYSDGLDYCPVRIQATQDNTLLYESDIYMDTYLNDLLLYAPSSTTPNIYSVIPFERKKTDNMYVYWTDIEDSSTFAQTRKDALLKCYIGIFPAEPTP